MDRARSEEARPSSEDTIHRCLAAVLGAAAVALLFAREPSAAHSGPGPADRDHPAPVAAEVTRPQLDAAIAMLTGWLERHAGVPRSPLEANLRLLSLGRAALQPTATGGHSGLVLANLQALAAPAASAPPASVPPTPADLAGGDRAAEGSAAEDRPFDDAAPAATLAILLEAGTPLDHELPLATGPTRLASLLEHALTRLDTRPGADPWTLDLLSFSLLGGHRERRETLARLAQLGLTRLDREQRQELEQSTEADALRLSLADPRRSEDSRARQLRLATSLFRAVAVLAEPSLEAPALRQLNALLERQPRMVELYRALLDQTRNADARTRIHIDALENLGHLEQALYGAHVAFGRSDRPGPSPRAAASMRRAACALLEHLDALRHTPGFDASPPPPELLRALTHALRGLRVSRIAT